MRSLEVLGRASKETKGREEALREPGRGRRTHKRGGTVKCKRRARKGCKSKRDGS